MGTFSILKWAISSPTALHIALVKTAMFFSFFLYSLSYSLNILLFLIITALLADSYRIFISFIRHWKFFAWNDNILIFLLNYFLFRSIALTIRKCILLVRIGVRCLYNMSIYFHFWINSVHWIIVSSFIINQIVLLFLSTYVYWSSYVRFICFVYRSYWYFLCLFLIFC